MPTAPSPAFEPGKGGAEKPVATRPVAQPSVTPSHLSPAYTELPAADTPFTGVADLFAVCERVQSEDGDGVVIAPASVKQYKALCGARDRRGRKLRLFFLANKRIIIVTLPTFEHEVLYGHFTGYLIYCMYDMGLQWLDTHAQTFQGSAGSRGEADGNGRPLPARKSKRDWPTTVFEAGFTQTLPSLRVKMAFWFSQSNHDVKIVVLAKAYAERADKRIRLEQWHERPATMPRPGATATRRTGQALRVQPTCLQTINITWAGPVPFEQATVAQAEDPSLYSVTRGPLQLSFEALFLRAPTPQEHDILFSDDSLQTYASRVWAS